METGAVRLRSLPPTRKSVIEALMAGADVPLSVDASCEGAGTDANDRTIGHYISGMLAQLDAPSGQSWLEVSIQPELDRAGPIWRLTVLIKHRDDEDEWAWGVRFAARQADGLVLLPSFECVGAG
jgi:hypothetical protein